MILLNPGPVNVTPRVAAALARGDLCHREPECYALLERVRARLLEAFARSGGFQSVLVTGSGTAAVEAAVSSVLSERGRLVIVANGVYGERMAAMAAAHRLAHTVVAGDWMAGPDLARVEQAVRAPDVEAVAVVHHETTTGFLTPVEDLQEFAALLARHPAAGAFVELKRASLAHHGIAPCLEGVLDALDGVDGRCVPISFDAEAIAAARAATGRPVGWVIERFDAACLDTLASVQPDYVFYDYLKVRPGEASLPTGGLAQPETSAS